MTTAKHKVGKLCRMFVNRSDNLGFRGKARDRNALEFIVGAYASAALMGDTDMELQLDRLKNRVSEEGFAAVLEAYQNAINAGEIEA